MAAAQLPKRIPLIKFPDRRAARAAASGSPAPPPAPPPPPAQSTPKASSPPSGSSGSAGAASIQPKRPKVSKEEIEAVLVSTMEEFKMPYFYNYPPYFTLQPVRSTREKQIQLWKELILKYSKHNKNFIINLDEDFPLFVNNSIDRKLSHEAREVFLGALVNEGKAEWLDKARRKCLILWRSINDWSNVLFEFVKEYGFEDSVMTLEEIRSGDETRGTELAGIDRLVLVRAVKVLEQRGKAVMFKGTSADDEGVKFSG